MADKDKNVQLNIDEKSWYADYEVPRIAYGIIDLILTFSEQRLIEAFGSGTFSVADVTKELGFESDDLSREFLDSAYRRVVVSITSPDTYKTNNFFSRLDIVAVAERDTYLSIPEVDREELESLYFDRYYGALDWAREGGLPTSDAVITYEETLDLVDSKNADGKPIYLVNCDCRSLKNSCNHLREVCISFDEGTNTWGDRGVSRQITLEEAKKVIARADKDGLIHTSNPHGICNCCTDCCYLFRSKDHRRAALSGTDASTLPAWPAVTKTITIDEAACIGCGHCVKRCPLGALSLKENTSKSIFRHKKAAKAENICIGCGLCISVCRPSALALRPLTA
jgi:ferredoxin